MLADVCLRGLLYPPTDEKRDLLDTVQRLFGPGDLGFFGGLLDGHERSRPPFFVGAVRLAGLVAAPWVGGHDISSKGEGPGPASNAEGVVALAEGALAALSPQLSVGGSELHQRRGCGPDLLEAALPDVARFCR